MSNITILLTIFLYFAVLLTVSLITGRKSTSNQAFFTGNHQSPWWVVAIGMIGASISGVSFISVPGMVGNIEFGYLQTVFGFFFGYLIIAHVLLPLYYRLGLTSIYTYLGQRFGKKSYTTGASFFLISKTIGASARLYVVALILQRIVFDTWNIPFFMTVMLLLILIWLYTFRSGIKSIVWTDTLQTIIMLVALCWMVYDLLNKTGLSVSELPALLANSSESTIFHFGDWHSKQHFVKQFFSGIFIAVVMTGLDQDMMQKNLSCKNLKDAQKNMHWYGFAFIPFNFLFLLLGFLILQFALQQNIQLPQRGDEILPFIATSYFNTTVFLLFILGVVAAAFSSADSALAALTTSFAVDILKLKPNDDGESGEKKSKHTRMLIHAGISVLFIFIILIFELLKNSSVIDTIYIIVSYTYGPLLGLYAFGLFTKRQANDHWVPWISVLSPVICFGIDWFTKLFIHYAFGYELLLLNGGLTFIALYISSLYGNQNRRIRHQ